MKPKAGADGHAPKGLGREGLNNLKKVILSVALLYHLAVITIAPNKATYLGQLIGRYMEPYTTIFEFGPNWNFFAPDPGPPPLYLEWEVISGQGDTIKTESFPEPGDPYFLRERQNRRVGMARFLFNNEDRYQSIMGAYVCRMNPGAYGVRFWKILYTIPGLFEVRDGKRTIGDAVGMERRSVGTIFCARIQS